MRSLGKTLQELEAPRSLKADRVIGVMVIRRGDVAEYYGKPRLMRCFRTGGGELDRGEAEKEARARVVEG